MKTSKTLSIEADLAKAKFEFDLYIYELKVRIAAYKAEFDAKYWYEKNKARYITGYKMKFPEIPPLDLPEIPTFDINIPEPTDLPEFDIPNSSETSLKFEEWIEKLPEDERNALCLNSSFCAALESLLSTCKYDVWKGAIETAIENLKLEHEVLVRHKLYQNANVVSGYITILKRMIED